MHLYTLDSAFDFFLKLFAAFLQSELLIMEFLVIDSFF